MLNLWLGSGRSKALRVQGYLVIVVALLFAAFGIFGTLTANAAVGVLEYTTGNMSTTAAKPYGIARGSDNNLWFTERLTHSVGRMTPSGTVTIFDTGSGSGASRIKAGPDGNLWIAESDANRLAKITTAGVVTEYVPPAAVSISGSNATSVVQAPFDLTFDPAGNIWFTENTTGNAPKLGRFNPATQQWTLFQQPTLSAELYGIVAAPNGIVYFSYPAVNYRSMGANPNLIGYIDSTAMNPTVTEVPSSATAGTGATFNTPEWMTIGPDNNMWFVGAFETSVYKFDIAATLGGTRTITGYAFGGSNTAPVGDPYDITVGPDNNLYVAIGGDPQQSTGASLNNQVARVTTSGVVTTYSTLTANSKTRFLTTGPNNTIWVTENADNINKIAVLTLPPTVTAITPTTGFNSATTSVTITGTGFLSGATVTVGGQACTNVNVVSLTSLTCAVKPKNTTGAQDVIVTNTDSQSSTLPASFTYGVAPAPSTTYVNPAFTGAFGSDPDGSGPATAIGYDAFPTIQAGVNAVATGGTVNVAAGTYTEQVSISKNLTFTGAGAASTIIKAPVGTGMTANGLGLELLLYVAGGTTTVTASGFTVNGPVTTPNACNDSYYGVFVGGGATLNLANATASNIRPVDNTLLGCQQGVGIRYGSGFLNQVAHGTINNVTVTGYAKAGIVIDGPGTNATVSNDIVTGDGPQDKTAQNGIQVSRGAVATVTGNTVSGNECNAAVCGLDGNSNTQSGGILLFNAGAGTVVSNNTVSSNDSGIQRSDDDASFPSVTISGNTLTGNRYEDLYLFGGPTTLSANTINGPTSIGIQLGQNTTTTPATNTGTVTYQNNTFGSGVTQHEVAPAPTIDTITPGNGFNSATTAITIAGTNFALGATITVGGQLCASVTVPTSASLTCTVQPKNTTGAVDIIVTNPDTKTGTKTGAFTYNARPAPSTTYVNPAFTGAFGSDPDGSGPATAIGYDAFPTIQAGVNAVATGGTVNVAAGTYTEQVLISKSLTFVGAGAVSTIIKAPAATGLIANSFGAEVLFDVEGGTVAASGFTVNGPVTTPNSCADDFYGVFVGGGATLNLANATVSNIRNADTSGGLLGCQQGLGIRYGSAKYNQVGNGSIDHVTVTGYQKNGITVTHNSHVTITNNTVTGDGPQTSIAQNGIEVGDNATVTVTGNTVSGNECNNASCGADGNTAAQSGGILVFDDTNGVTLTGNTLTNNDIGILLGDDAGKLTTLVATGNTLIGNRYEGIYLLGGPTTLTNNTITGPGNIGVQLGISTDPTVPPTTGTVTYQNNTISSYTKIGAATPTLSGITPNTSNGASQSVTLTGAFFPLGATVAIGGQACTNVSIPNSITLICTAPTFATSGAKDVVITTPNPNGNNATLAGAYTVTVGVPTITSLSPNAGVVTGGTQVTINGTGFLTGTQVKIDGQLISSTLVNDTKIVFTTAAHSTGAVTITVVTAGGQTSNGATFTFGTINAQPVITPVRGIGASGTIAPRPTPHGTVAASATATPLPAPIRH